MQLRHLRYFIAVAEQLNFRKAAELLRVSQPPLSAQIKDLEIEVGARLFDRDNRKVSLTAEGRVFFQHATQIIERVDAARMAVGRVGRVGRGEEGELRVGFTESSEFLPFVTSTIFYFKKLYPHISLSLEEMTSQSQVEAIVARKLDLGIGRMPTGRNPNAASFTQLHVDRLMLAVHTSDPLAVRRHVTIGQLRSSPFIVHRPDHDAGLYRRLLDLCKEEGFAPTITQEAREVTTCIALVASGLGVTIVPSSMRCVKLNDVAYLPLVGSGTEIHLFMITGNKDDNDTVSVFKRMLLEAVADSATG